MIKRKTDNVAARAGHMSRMPACLHIPIAARDLNAIKTYVGDIVSQLSPRAEFKALMIAAHNTASPDTRLPIWSLPESSLLQNKTQVWVDVNYTGYRAAYARAFPDSSLNGLVLDHVLNRRLARMKGFSYLRIVPISRATNSSHGGLSERWAVDIHDKPRQTYDNSVSKAQIQYADVADIAKILDLGGEGRFMEGVNKVHELIKLNSS